MQCTVYVGLAVGCPSVCPIGRHLPLSAAWARAADIVCTVASCGYVTKGRLRGGRGEWVWEARGSTQTARVRGKVRYGQKSMGDKCLPPSTG